MTAHFLDPIFTPASIAVAGASNNPLKMGTIQFLNLLGGGFSGKVFPLHPKEKKIFGHKAYPGPADLPQVPDLALLVVPTSVVPELLDEFGKIGTKGAIIISAGFKETGENGAGLEADLKKHRPKIQHPVHRAQLHGGDQSPSSPQHHGGPVFGQAGKPGAHLPKRDICHHRPWAICPSGASGFPRP